MGLREEIDYVLAEEERKTKRTQAQSKRMSSAASRRMKPTYFAVVAAKIIFFLRRFKKEKPPVPAEQRQQARKQVQKKPGVSMWSIFIRDIRRFRRWVQVKLGFVVVKPRVPGDDESWTDWEDQV